MITPAQCLKARKLLKWSRDRLAPRCGFSAETLRKFERGSYSLATDQLISLQQALEAAGVEFTNIGEPGVKLRKQA
jgi:transcriptional regulator with XRE-family HTH domain